MAGRLPYDCVWYDELMQIPSRIISLVQRFSDNELAYRETTYNKTMLKHDFVEPFFKALGWEFQSDYRSIISDVKQFDKLPKSGPQLADYSFHDFLLAVEKPSVAFSDDPVPALLLRQAASKAGLPTCVLTNFGELAIYDCTQAVSDNDTSATARILQCSYTDYAQRWGEIEALLCNKAIGDIQ